jgi:hypothetical protein
MKKLLAIFHILILLFLLPAFGQEITEKPFTNDDVILYQVDEKWGLKDQNGEILTEPIYKKMIRIGYHSWLVQTKRNKYGLTDEYGNIIIEPRYRHTDRILGKYVKLGNTNDFGIYNEYGELIIPHEYQKIDLLFGKMFLTMKNYKYGVMSFDGKTLLENEFDDIYMPSSNVMRILYNGEWYEIEQVNSQTLTLPENAKEHIYDDNGINLYKFVKETGIVSGYSVITFSDYIIKLFSSISPAHEETIDELMLSHGADTITILKKLSWIPKYPITYAQKYYTIVRNPNSGPLVDFKNDLKRKMN